MTRTTIMDINEILRKKGMTKYRLSVLSGVPHATLNNICSGRSRIEKCSAETLYKLAQILHVTIFFVKTCHQPRSLMLFGFFVVWAREVFCCLRATVCFFGVQHIDCFVFLTFQRAGIAHGGHQRWMSQNLL